MQQLSGVDASFLNMETASQFGHVASLTMYEPADGPGEDPVDAIKRTLGERLHRLPVFRRRLATVPFGLDNPYWIDDPDFDLDFHVRRMAAPSPGDDHQLAALVADIMSRPLDRSRPLWELYVITDLDDGGTAVLTKMHHAFIDGGSGVELLSILLDASPDGDPVESIEPWTPERSPTQLELMNRTLLALAARPGGIARFQLRAARGLARSARNIGLTNVADLLGYGLPGPLGKAARDINRRFVRPRTEVDVPPRLPNTPAPRTSFNRAITAHRRYAFTTTSLADAKTVKETFGTTLNDVVMALCSGVLRRYLDKRDELPADPLIAMVPVSLRTGDEADPFSNRISAVLAPLATDLADPVARLLAIHDSMTAAKEMQAALPIDVLQDMVELAPPALAARAARMTSRVRMADRTNPPFNVVISNVLGPRSPLYLAGAQMTGFYPVSTVTDGQGVNLTVHSYLGSLDWGFISCRELLPDIWELTDHLHDAMAELLDAAHAARD